MSTQSSNSRCRDRLTSSPKTVYIWEVLGSPCNLELIIPVITTCYTSRVGIELPLIVFYTGGLCYIKSLNLAIWQHSIITNKCTEINQVKRICFNGIFLDTFNLTIPLTIFTKDIPLYMLPSCYFSYKALQYCLIIKLTR